MLNKEILPEMIKENIFELIGKDWMLISAGDEKSANAMTASWGGMGVLWNKNVVYTVIRPQRYTKEFVETNGSFAVSFFADEKRDMMSYFGRVSGRDEDKIKKANLSVLYADGAPYFKEAKLSLICKKLYSYPLSPEGFCEKDLIEKNYPASDFHIMYVGEIVKAFSE